MQMPDRPLAPLAARNLESVQAEIAQEKASALARMATRLEEALRRLEAAGVVPEDLALRKPTLDDVFLALTGHRTNPPTGNLPEPSGRADRHRQQQPERAAR